MTQTHQKTNLFIYGLTGKMGQEIADLASDSLSFTIVGGTSTSTPSPLLPCHVALDFSHNTALKEHLNEAVSKKIPLMVGTTGLSADDQNLIQQASKHIPILYASNTSIGVAVMMHLVKQAAKMLDDNFDIEIFETHHRQKIDAPSGTALALGKAAAAGQNKKFEHQTGTREGKREPNTIGYAVHRGGGVFGEHSVRFIGDEEIIEVTHRSLSRRLFARGALKAALWLKDQPSGLYTIDRVLT